MDDLIPVIGLAMLIPLTAILAHTYLKAKQLAIDRQKNLVSEDAVARLNNENELLKGEILALGQRVENLECIVADSHLLGEGKKE